MKHLHFFLFALLSSLFIISCSDNEFDEIEEQEQEEIVADFYEKEDYLSDIIPQYILDKLNAEEPLTKEDQLNADKVSYAQVHYNGRNHTIEEMYESTFLYEKYMSKETFTGVYYDRIVLFDSKKELEDFEENIKENLQRIFPISSRNWWGGSFNWSYQQSFAEHANFSGSLIHFWSGFENGISNIGVVLPTNWWYRVSASLLYVDNASSLYVVDQKVSYIGYKSDRFYFDLVKGSTGQQSAYLNIPYYANFTIYPGEDWIIDGYSGDLALGISSHSNQNDKLIGFTVSTHLAANANAMGNSVVALSHLNSFANAVQGALGGNPAAAFQLVLDIFSAIVNNNVEGEVVSLSGNFKFKKPGDNKWLVIDSDQEIKMRDGHSNQWYMIPDGIAEFGNFPGFHDFRAANGYAVDQDMNNQSNVYLGPANEGNNQKWIVLMYRKWYWPRAEYKIMNVETGKAIHWNDNNSVYMANANPTRDKYERFHME